MLAKNVENKCTKKSKLLEIPYFLVCVAAALWETAAALSQRGQNRAGDADQSFALLEENTLIPVKSHSSKEKKGD